MNILYTLLSELNIEYSKVFTDNWFKYNEYPKSLTDISNFLFEFGIDSMQIKLPFNHLNEIDYPCLAILNDNELVVFTSYTKERVVYIDEKNNRINEPTEKFISSWDGVLLLIGKDENSQEPNFRQNKKIDTQNKWKKISIWAGLILVSLIPFIINSKGENLITNISFVIKYFGTIVSVLLILKHLGKTPLIDKLCSFNRKVSCDEVIHSRVSNIFSWLNLADLAFIYFSGTWIGLFLYLFLDMSHGMSLFLTLNCVGVLLALFLFFYQAFKIKKWCPLCMVLMALLLAEFYILKDYISVSDFNLSTLGIIVLGLFCSSWILLLFKTPLKKSKMLSPYKKNLYSYSKNPIVLKSLLESSEVVDTLTYENDLSFGNKNATFNMIVVTNPTCGPCARTHQEIKNLMRLFPNDLNITYRFLVNSKKDDSIAVLVSKAILKFHSENQDNSTLKLINSWFELKDKSKVQSWISENNLAKKNGLDSPSVLEIYTAWCIKNNISVTPTIVLNNKIVPQMIQPIYLKYYLRDSIK